MSETNTPQGFRALGLAPSILVKLDRLGFVTPTPIQRDAIPHGLAGRDVVGIAQTGTGKTLAFGLPMISRMRGYQTGLVLAPTRELAQQIEETFKQLGVKTALIIGGAAMGPQIGQLRRQPQVIVATPGRLMDHMAQKTVELRNVAVVVLDEADRMLDMGFAPAIQKIMEAVPKDRQTMLFSATMPQEIYSLAARYMRNPERVEVARAGTAADLVEQELLVVPHEDKQTILGGLLKENEGTVLVFARTRHGARKLARTIRNFGHSAAELHSDRTLSQRREALDGFKKGLYRVLVATDIAARGIDVKKIALVVNFDVPENPEDYVHRIGRTGRAGASGRAVTLATPEQHRDVRDIEKLLKTELPLGASSPLTMHRPKPAERSPIASPPRRGSSRRPVAGSRR
ncbi:MAG TPA: DEAD/DEAH box helicase [Fimbriimonas sp.]